MLWMISDLYYGFLSPILLDIFILAGGLIWLSLRPGLWPTSLLCIYQTLALFSNVIVLFYVSLAVNTHQALLVHITWRGLALLSMLAYFIFRAYAKVGNIESPEGDGERTCRDERIADSPSPEGRAAGRAAT